MLRSRPVCRLNTTPVAGWGPATGVRPEGHPGDLAQLQAWLGRVDSAHLARVEDMQQGLRGRTHHDGVDAGATGTEQDRLGAIVPGISELGGLLRQFLRGSAGVNAVGERRVVCGGPVQAGREVAERRAGIVGKAGDEQGAFSARYAEKSAAVLGKSLVSPDTCTRTKISCGVTPGSAAAASAGVRPASKSASAYVSWFGASFACWDRQRLRGGEVRRDVSPGNGPTVCTCAPPMVGRSTPLLPVSLGVVRLRRVATRIDASTSRSASPATPTCGTSRTRPSTPREAKRRSSRRSVCPGPPRPRSSVDRSARSSRRMRVVSAARRGTIAWSIARRSVHKVRWGLTPHPPAGRRAHARGRAGTRW